MTSIASSADAAEERSLAAGAPRRSRLSRLLLILAVLIPTAIAVDLSVNKTFGSDVRVNCAAVDAHREGLDPYFVRNLKGTDLSYPYLPVTLDAFRPLCAGGFLVAHYNAIYLVLGLICVLLLPGLGGGREGLRDVMLRGVFALGGFLGFEWVLASGNFAMLSGLLTAASLALLLRPAQSEGREDGSFMPQLAGAALLGLVTSFKLVFVPVLAALYLLPQPRRRKLVLIAVAAGMFALPILVSAVFYSELFSSWLSAIFGQIPDSIRREARQIRRCSSWPRHLRTERRSPAASRSLPCSMGSSRSHSCSHRSSFSCGVWSGRTAAARRSRRFKPSTTG